MYTRRPHVKTNVRNVNYFADRTFLPGVIHFNYVSTEFLTGTLIFFLLIIQFKVFFFYPERNKMEKNVLDFTITLESKWLVPIDNLGKPIFSY